MNFAGSWGLARLRAEVGQQLADQAVANARSAARRSRSIHQLQEDVEFLSLVCMSLLSVLEKKGVMTPEELKGAIEVVDEFDGARDGRMDADNARDSLGVKRAARPRRFRRR